MEWYVPITVLPAIGLLILSTTNQMLSLSAEIGSLLSTKCNPFQHKISDLKIRQLSKLTKAVTLLYVSAAFFVLSGLMGAFIGDSTLDAFSRYVLIIGVCMMLVALFFLIVYGLRAIKIRRMQHVHNHGHSEHGLNEN